MKVFAISLFVATVFSISGFTQVKPKEVLVTINNRPVTAGEFERVYLKNSQVGTSEKESVESYFDLYVKFKLKVTAAIDSGLDKLPSFINELKGYKEQLAKNYLTDTTYLNKLVKEAYNRMLTDVNSSHIMILLQNNPSPKDTLVAWEKISKIQARLKNGESFEKLAVECSEDPEAKTSKGVLGYFSCFQLPYEFENAAYNTPVGSVSPIVRTKFGYHLIKVNGRRKSPGEVKVAHIMVASPESNSDEQKKQAKEKINDFYKRIQAGESFDTIARKYSDDQYSGRNNGELPWFGTHQMMVPEFEEASFSLQNIGDISQPVKTQFGWHIIKLLGTKPVQPFDKIKNDIKTKIAQNDRNELVNISFLNKLKNEYKPVINKKAIEKLYKLDSSFFKKDTSLAIYCDTNAILVKIKNTNYKVKPFLDLIKTRKNGFVNWTVTDFLNQMLNEHLNSLLLQYENSQLENKYPDYAGLSQEYFEGILLFDIMEKNVWSKASSDSIGLVAYYEKNKAKYSDPEVKPLDEIRGLVMSDYQNYLEENWIAELRKKYPVVINQKVLDKIAQKYNSKQNAK